MKCIFLYNPNSGRGKVKRKLPLIEKKLRQVYDEVTIVATNGVEDLEHLVRESADTYDAVIFSGGDGTFNNVIEGLGEKEVQLGYIPSGTVNDVARALKIPRNIRGALKVIAKGNTKSVDCMLVNQEHHAMYIAAAGAFTCATYSTPQSQKKLFGALAYAVEAVRHHLKLEVFPLKVECGGKTVETNAVLILVMNGTSVAGFPINQIGSMTDGMLEVAVIKQVYRPNWFQRIAKLFSVASLFVFGCKIKKKDIVLLQGKEVKITTQDNVVWDFDGEEGIRGDVVITPAPRQLKIFAPNKK
jgi:diacylglycerol kinase (ATP)